MEKITYYEFDEKDKMDLERVYKILSMLFDEEENPINEKGFSLEAYTINEARYAINFLKDSETIEIKKKV